MTGGAVPSEPSADGVARAVADLVSASRFAPVRGRDGYDMGQVDEFLDEVVDEVRSGRPITALVDRVRFDSTRVREGYCVTDVDTLLDQVVALVRESGAPEPAAPAPAGTTSPTPRTGRSLISRVLGRRP